MEYLHMIDEYRYEVRRVPSNWVHPVDGIGKYILLSNYDDDLKQNLITKYIGYLRSKYDKSECVKNHNDLTDNLILDDMDKFLIRKKEKKFLKR